jgi:hypothetical protein
MSSDAASFVGSIPEQYDHGLGPIIFAPGGRLQSGARSGDRRRYRDCHPPVAQFFASGRALGGD